MQKKHSFWQTIIHPDTTLPLLLTVGFFLLNACGFFFDAYYKLNEEGATSAMVVSLITGVRYAIPAAGLVRMKRWARLAEIILSIIAVATGAVLLLAGALGGGLFSIIIHGLIIYYLFSEKCRRAFHLSV